jgi:CRISPR-associated endonuclease/helicase Cas3
LVDHSADVAAVVGALLAQPTINRRLARSAGLDLLDRLTCRRLEALAFLHDIGKANRGFRARVDPHAPIVGHIDQVAWIFADRLAADHCDRLCAILGLERIEAWFAPNSQLWDTVFAHHGRPWKVVPADPQWRVIGDSDPIGELAPMRAALDRWFGDAFAPAPPLPNVPAFDHAFAGLLMLADWLGSDEEFFPFADGSDPDRMTFSRQQATTALEAVGLAVEPRRVATRKRPLSFPDLFTARTPRPIQERATVPTANCVVLEAETGSGKTEAALWRFASLFAAGQVDGLYFALPTRVAATQMFARIKRLRDAMFPGDDRPAVVLAVPGQVGVDDAKGYRLPDFGFEWSDEPNEQQRRSRWAAEHPKRFLAAQIAVGTIDQVLLGSIATKHAHLRGTALLRHLLVVDEVHASDRFMETLLTSLLRSHLQAGGHALLLSATLGAGMQARLLGIPQRSLAEAETAAYPAYGWAENGQAAMLPVPSSGEPKQVRIEAVGWMDDPTQVAATAHMAAQAGAKVLVIRNTVAAAIATAQALEGLGADAALFRVAGIATLHHGRFGAADRQLLDAAVEAALGKDSPACAKIVIGTQTLEASLDLDADLLITDLCPMDVLLQRIGRLHRHHDRSRPAGFALARTMVLTPPTRDLLPLLRGGRGRHGLGRVYPDARIIEATWRLIETKPEWLIPDMNRMLVEHTTHPEVLVRIEQALKERDGAWAKVIDAGYGQYLAQSQTGIASLLDRNATFDTFRIPEGEAWATRLGAKDQQVEFPTEVIGPFGGPVGRLRVAHHLVEDLRTEDLPQILEQGPDRVLFALGKVRLIYDRFGLRAYSP